MKKLILSALCVLAVSQTAFADGAEDIYASVPAPNNAGDITTIFSGNSISLMSSESNSLDFSLLDGVFTVEVSGDIPSDASLIVGEYDEDGRLIGAQLTDNVQSENKFNVSGAYEKAFLWNMDTLSYFAPSISTKCSYDIIEGTDGDWEVSEDGHTLYNYTGESCDVVIPNSYKGKRIYSIGNIPAVNNAPSPVKSADFYKYNIFNGRTDITSAAIPEGIIVINTLSFAGCEKITGELSLPSTCRIVWMYAFYNCIGFTGCPDTSSLAMLGTGAFMNCRGLNGNLKLPALNEIPANAFANCSGFTCELNIPDGVETLGYGAFAAYSSPSCKFSALTLPDTLKTIGVCEFQNQTGFKNELKLPDGLEHIGDFAFNHCSGFSNTSLVIPSSVKTIGGDYNVDENTGYGGHVFYDSFKKVTEFIANGEYFTSLDGVLYSKNMTRLVAYPPAKTDTEFEIPEGVIQLDEMSLGYSKIKTLTLPDSYVLSETVPENIINNMANNLAVALYHYNSIENISVKDTNEKYASADGILYSKDMKELWYVPTQRRGEIVVCDGTQTIHKGAFYLEYANGAEKYTSVSIPSSVTYIHPETIRELNNGVKSTVYPITITVDAQNTVYKTAEDGCLVEKTQ